ncbi:phytoene/squalene synthase family protein [Nesterenkonia ebinurensis]|uniref:phytoene/squalene synthase family protein n=1 Tax=Nesterenkonia ebinurensis TaxID=2608252 RepID=UPI00123D4822|nr:squalene/phytoene synthase family protein [Nesterenkonia ebinurensis]
MRRTALSSHLELYSHTAQAASSRVIREYSTSFGLATSLLPAATRSSIRSIYALVRVADEIVDGTAEEAGLDGESRKQVLDALEEETLTALQHGFSANLIVHCFAVTGRAAGIEEALINAFFRSMRRDLTPVVSLSEEQYRTYVHGSAETVGLMCLRVFLQGLQVSQEERERMEIGAAHLGAAFQKINFLRDFAEDFQQLGRTYFPGTCPGVLGEHRKTEIIADIDADLTAARRALPLLPPGPRRATALATGLFGELNERLRRTPAADLHRIRVSVPKRVKARIIAAALLPMPSGAVR